MKQPFQISIIEKSIDLDTARGEIHIGDFHELFELPLDYWSVETYKAKWREALSTLISHRNIVTLATWMHDPNETANRRAWVLYREDNQIFVQELLFPAGDPIKFDSSEQIIVSGPRETRDEEGNRISEWRTSVESVIQFLKSNAI